MEPLGEHLLVSVVLLNRQRLTLSRVLTFDTSERWLIRGDDPALTPERRLCEEFVEDAGLVNARGDQDRIASVVHESWPRSHV